MAKSSHFGQTVTVKSPTYWYPLPHADYMYIEIFYWVDGSFWNWKIESSQSFDPGDPITSPLTKITSPLTKIQDHFSQNHLFKSFYFFFATGHHKFFRTSEEEDIIN